MYKQEIVWQIREIISSLVWMKDICGKMVKCEVGWSQIMKSFVYFIWQVLGIY